MNFRESLAMRGNVNTIINMDSKGVGANAIAGTFQDNGISISADDVRTVLRITPELTKKALPKAVSNAVIEATVGSGDEVPI